MSLYLCLPTYKYLQNFLATDCKDNTFFLKEDLSKHIFLEKCRKKQGKEEKKRKTGFPLAFRSFCATFAVDYGNKQETADSDIQR